MRKGFKKTLYSARTGKLIRWFNHLSPDVSKEKWSDEDSERLFREFLDKGCSWKLISKAFKNRSHVSVKNRFFSLNRKILRRLSRMQERPFDNSKLTAIKPKILYEIFSITIRVTYGKNQQTHIAFQTIIMSFFNNFKDFLGMFQEQERKIFLTKLLGLILSINQDYVDNGNKKIRKYKFIKSKVYDIDLDQNESDDGTLKKVSELDDDCTETDSRILNLLNELKVNFLVKFLGIQGKVTHGQSHLDDHRMFFGFSDMVHQFNQIIDVMTVTIPEKEDISETVGSMMEMLFIKEFDKNFVLPCSFEEERKILENGHFKLEFLDSVIAKIRDKLKVNSKDPLCDILSNDVSFDQHENSQLNNLKFESNVLVRGISRNTLDSMSLFSCEMFNKEYASGYNKKNFDHQLCYNPHSEFSFN